MKKKSRKSEDDETTSDAGEDAADRKIQEAIAQARAERELAARPTHRRAGPVIITLLVIGALVGALVYFHAYAWLIVLAVTLGLGGVLYKLVAETPPHGDASSGE
jgi:hypothetical protein